MTVIAPLPASQFCSLSPPASSWRWADATETSSTSCSSPTTFGKVHAQISQTASSPLVEASDPGASARNRDRPALTAVFKSP
jgi:hypothetical protein